MSTWDLINMSDAILFDAVDLEVAAFVTVALGGGQYGAEEEGGSGKVPIMLFGVGTFFEDNFSKDAETWFGDMKANRAEDLARAFESVRYVHERSSLNNIGARAKAWAEGLREGKLGPAASRQVFS